MCGSLPGFSSRLEVEDFACTFCGGPTTDHPCSLPASPDTSEVGDVVRRYPPQGMQTNSEHSTISSVMSYAQKVSGCEGPLVT